MNKVILAKRAKKLNVILNEVLLNETNNQKLNNFTITEVRLSLDGQIATIYISVLGSDTKKDSVMKQLNHSKGYLRSQAAKSWSLYRIPNFIFKYDETFDSAHNIESLLNNIEYTTTGDEDEE